MERIHGHLYSTPSLYRRQWTAEGSVFGAVSMCFFVWVWNIPATAERICAKFTRKTCFGPSLGRVWRCQRSRSPGQKRHFRPFRWPACSLCLVKPL